MIAYKMKFRFNESFLSFLIFLFIPLFTKAQSPGDSISASAIISIKVDSQLLYQKAEKFIIEPELEPQQPPKIRVMGAVASSYDVGEIPYTTDVTSSGAYTVNVPINVFPGINGMQPNISLVYNGQAGSGNAGYGWNLSAASVITRRYADKYHEGYTANVEMHLAVPFLSLDGQKLIAVNVNGSILEYQPETNNSIKIIADRNKMSVANAIAASVYYPNGNKAEYSSDETGRFFFLTKLTDNNSNYIEYVYQKNSNGERLLTEIKYGGNSLQGTTHFASVKIIYRDRLDFKKNVYENCFTFPQNSIVNYIQVFYNGAEQRRYTCAYISPTGFSTQLQKISLSELGKELPPLIFNYGNSTVDNVSQSTTEVTERYADMSNTKVIVQPGRFAYFDESDGVIVYPNKNAWSTTKYNNITALWGEYSPSENIYVYQDLSSSYSIPYKLSLGEGFRTALTGNIDDSQEDEIIKINAVGGYGGYETLTIGAYTPNVYGGFYKVKESVFTLPTYSSQNGFYNATPK